MTLVKIESNKHYSNSEPQGKTAIATLPCSDCYKKLARLSA